MKTKILKILVSDAMRCCRGAGTAMSGRSAADRAVAGFGSVNGYSRVMVARLTQCSRAAVVRGPGRSRDKVRKRTGEERPLAEVFVERKEGPNKWHSSTDIASIVFTVV